MKYMYFLAEQRPIKNKFENNYYYYWQKTFDHVSNSIE